MKTTRGRFWVFFIAGFITTSIFTYIRKSSEDNDTAPQAKAFPQAISAREANAFMTENLREKGEALKAKREAERAEAERIEAERLADWKANFPYKPIYHPTLRYDPKIYRQGDSSTYNDEGRRLLQPVTLKHCFLKGFFENPLRFSKQFEQLHDILAEYDRAYDPFILGKIFETTRMYWEARQHDPDELWGTIDATTGKYNPSTGEWEYKSIPHDGKTTWGETAEKMKEGILATLTWRRRWIGNTPPASEEEAQEITNRIITEMDGFEDLEGIGFGYVHKYETDIEPNSQLLIPYEGWLEDCRAWQKEAFGWEPPPGHP